MAALGKLNLSVLSKSDRAVWMECARLDAVLGGRVNLSALRSGLRCYTAFVGLVCLFLRGIGLLFCLSDAACVQMQSYFPPSLNVLLAWSTLFPCPNTLANYFSYVKAGCLIVGASVGVRAFRIVNGISSFLIEGVRASRSEKG